MEQIINNKNDNAKFINILNIYDKMVYEENNSIIPIQGSMKLYTIQEEHIKLDIYKYPEISFSEEEKKQAFNILFIGEIGVGKTTLINSFLNVLMGVEIDSKIRYVITSEDTSKINYNNPLTDDVYIYNIKARDGKFYQIIDTPGFNNDFNQDKIITEKIYKLFKEKITFINALCIVQKSSESRLHFRIKINLRKILNLFGENLKTNLITMLTFYNDDEHEPIIVKTLKEFPIYSKMISYIEEPWYYNFNNRSFFSANINDHYVKYFWNISYKNYESFIKRLEKLEKKNLSQTVEFLNERLKLPEKVENSYGKYILLLEKKEQYKKLSISK
jgi:GTPase SAR1 family protein